MCKYGLYLEAVRYKSFGEMGSLSHIKANIAMHLPKPKSIMGHNSDKILQIISKLKLHLY